MILLALGSLSWVIAQQSQQRYFEETSQRLNRPIAMYIADKVPLFINGHYDKQALSALAAHVMIINPSLELYLLDPEGRVVASALGEDDDTVEDVVVDLEPIKTFLSSGNATTVYGDDPKQPDRRRVFSAFELTDSGIEASGCAPCGYVYAVLGGEPVTTPWQALKGSQTLLFSTLMLLALLLCALLAGLSVFFLLTRPLRAMTASIGKWRLAASETQQSPTSQVSQPVKHRGNELETLEQTCHAMARRMSRQYVELDNADRRRREFLTRLSHDLRTPLTSVSGALETVLKKRDELSSVEKNRFLLIAYRQTECLHRLIDQVFELARLDSGDVTLEMEMVSVQELAMDTVQDFEPQATRKGVNLSFEPADPDGEYLVEADPGQLNRVMVNLLSNAIRATPKGGAVMLSTHRDQDKGMGVTVKDSGCGFTKALTAQPLSQTEPIMLATSSLSGTGLGLGIVARILALHGAEARIWSAPGKGTQVRFFLSAPAVA